MLPRYLRNSYKLYRNDGKLIATGNLDVSQFNDLFTNLIKQFYA